MLGFASREALLTLARNNAGHKGCFLLPRCIALLLVALDVDAGHIPLRHLLLVSHSAGEQGFRKNWVRTRPGRGGLVLLDTDMASPTPTPNHKQFLPHLRSQS